MGVVENKHGLLGHRTVKSALSKEWIDDMSLFCACLNKFMKAKNSWF